MEKEKKGFWKRIGALIMSGFMAMSGITVEAKALDSGNANNPNAVKMERNVDIDAIRNNDFKKLLQKYEDIKMIGDDLFSISEIMQTRIESDVCETMVPQGLTVVDDMFLITAYDGIEGYRKELQLNSYIKEYRDKLKELSNHETHNSVIYVFDKETKKQITTIELPDKNHVGGIAYDGKNIYIAKSTDRQVSVIPVERIKTIVDVAKVLGQMTTYVDYESNIDCDGNASFVGIRETRNGKKQLSVGTWSIKQKDSKVRLYDLESEEPELVQEIPIQLSANGAEFVYGEDGEEYLLVASSLGRKRNSVLFINRIEENEEGKIEAQAINSAVLPPMVEEVTSFQGEDGKTKIGIGTEAFSKRYEIGRAKNFAKGIIIADLESLLHLPKREMPKIKHTEAIVEEIDDLREREEEEEKDI